MGQYNFPCPSGCKSTISIQLSSTDIPKIDELEKEGKGLPFYCSICKQEHALFTNYEELRNIARQP